MNLRLGDGLMEAARIAYGKATGGRGLASDCIRCGQCNRVCTQNIDVMAKLRETALALE